MAVIYKINSMDTYRTKLIGASLRNESKLKLKKFYLFSPIYRHRTSFV